MKTTTTWISHLAFNSVDDNNHIVRLDTTEADGSLNSGISPKKMLLGALNTCSGMDVVGILQKMKVPFTFFEIEANAEQTTTHPKVFTYIQLVYKADIDTNDAEKFKKAIELSLNTYCGIAAMLQKHCPINYSIKVLPSNHKQ
ncbi:MAG: OsmC family protein [Bacteroidota bacterium]|jgi:putative redox protein|nr:OsmC family protein [Bacteroidota bacterium]